MLKKIFIFGFTIINLLFASYCNAAVFVNIDGQIRLVPHSQNKYLNIVEYLDANESNYPITCYYRCPSHNISTIAFTIKITNFGRGGGIVHVYYCVKEWSKIDIGDDRYLFSSPITAIASFYQDYAKPENSWAEVSCLPKNINSTNKKRI